MTGAYQPYRPARRPGGKPQAKPRYRVLVHRKFAELWQALPQRVGVTSVQQFYDHVAHTPGQPAAINRTGVLRGKAGEPMGPGFSRTIHYEISGAGRIDYQYHDTYPGGATATRIRWCSSEPSTCPATEDAVEMFLTLRFGAGR